MSSDAAAFHVPDAAKRAYSSQKRLEKRLAAEEIGVDAIYVDHFVEAFYAKVRVDDLLGPIFAARIDDWPAHLARMKAFWRSVLHNSGEFSGNPMLKHLAILVQHHAIIGIGDDTSSRVDPSDGLLHPMQRDQRQER